MLKADCNNILEHIKILIYDSLDRERPLSKILGLKYELILTKSLRKLMSRYRKLKKKDKEKPLLALDRNDTEL